MESNEAIAGPESLLTWLNSFDVMSGCVEAYGDLVSGELLLKCLRTVTPDLPVGDPWAVLYQTLEEYCGCSLAKSVSLEKISTGDQEHIARAIVLFLCLAVEHKPNEDIVERITALELKVQWDIMFYIEATQAKISSHSIEAGTFTSGIGSALPTPGQAQFSIRLLQTPDPASPQTVPPDPAVMATPLSRCPSHSRLKQQYYSGLESPAGVKWLKSVKTLKTPRKTQDDCPPAAIMSAGEELPRLQHRVRVLERALESETRLSKEYYNEVCVKTTENSALELRCVQAEDRLEKLREMQDLQDELEQANQTLARTSAALTSCRSQVDTLLEFKEKTAVFESKCEDYRSNLHHQEKKVEQLEAALQESCLDLERASKALDMAHLDRQTREEQTTQLLLDNKELLKEKAALCEQLELKVCSEREARAALEEKTEHEQILTGQVKEIQLFSEKKAQALQDNIKEQLAAFDSERSSLQKQLSDAHSQSEELSQELTAITEERTHLESTLDAAREEGVVLQEETAKFKEESKRERERLEDNIQELSKQTRSLEEKIGKINLQYSLEKECQNTELETLNQSLLKATQQFESDRESLQIEIDSLQYQLRDTTEESQANSIKFDEAKQAFENEIELLKKQLDDDKTTAQVALAGTMQAMKTASDKHLESQKMLRDNFESEIAALKQALLDTEEHLEQLNAAKENEVSDLQQALLDAAQKTEKDQKCFDTEIEDLQQQLVEVSENNLANIVKFETERETMESKVSDLQQQLSSLLSEKTALHSALSEMEVTLETMKNESAANFNQYKTEQDTHSKEMASLKAGLLESTETRKREQELFQAQITEIEVAKALATARHEEAIATLKSELSTLDKQLNSVTSEKADLQATLSQMEADLESVKSESAINLNREQESHGKEVESLKAVLTESTESFKQGRENFQSQMKEMETERALADAKYETVCQEMESLKLALAEATGNLKHERESFQSQLKEMETEKALADKGHLELLATLKDERDAAEETFQKEIEELVKQNKTLEDQLETAISEKALALASSSAALSELKKKTSASIAQAELRVEALQETTEQLTRQLQSTQMEAKTNKERYLTALKKAEQSSQRHTSKVQELMTKNTEILGKQESLFKHLKEDDLSRQQKQEQLDGELRDLQEREQEATALCQEFDSALQNERTKNTAFRKHIEDITTKNAETSKKLATENIGLQSELNEVRKQLAREQHRAAKLTSEVKSLDTQLSYASHKLRDFEQKKQRASSPSPPQRSHRANMQPTQSARTSATTKRNPQLNVEEGEEEFFSHIHRDFDSGAEISTIPYEAPVEDEEEYDASLDEGLQSAYQLNRIPSKQTTMAAPHKAGSSNWDTLSQLRSSLASTRDSDDSAGVRRGENGKERIGELQRRNRDVLPHLKSSYPIELQVQPESPSVSDERVKNGSKKKKQISKRTTIASTLSDKATVAAPPLVIKRKRKISPRERQDDKIADPSLCSPLPSRRRTSAPPTPQTPADILVDSNPEPANSRRFTVAPSSFKLREYLDHSEPKEATFKPPRESSAFEISFSPPKSFKEPKKLPRRLQENRSRTHVKPTESEAAAAAAAAAGSGLKKKKSTRLESTLRARAFKIKN